MKLKSNFAMAWVLLTSALALHVLDEALNDFLSLYNPLVSNLNKQMGFFSFPVFTFSLWLTGLIVIIIVLFGLTYFARQRKKWILYFAYFYGVLMVMNGLGHIVGTFYYNKLIAGVYTSPLLLISSFYLLWSAGKAINKRKR